MFTNRFIFSNIILEMHTYIYLYLIYFLIYIIRYSSDDTDEDTSTNVVKKKKTTSNLRRQTMANPMPPPSTKPVDTGNITKNLIKENVSPHTEFKDPSLAPSVSSFLPTSSTTSRVTSKIQNRFGKIQRVPDTSDGLETGSDSDVVEDTTNLYGSRSKYLSNANKLYDPHRLHDRGGFDYDQTSKTRPIQMTKDNKYNINTSLMPNVSPIQSMKEDISGRDSVNQRDLLANYETPYLSEFTRRLSSSRSLINTSSSTLPSLQSKIIGTCYALLVFKLHSSHLVCNSIHNEINIFF